MEELDFFSENEIEYIERNFERISFYDMCKSLRMKVLARTGKTWSDSQLIKEIRKINPERKKYIVKIETPEVNEVDKEKIMKMSINGYKPVKFYTNIVLFEKEVNGNTFRTCYKYCDLRGV